ncbi:hypothetical protein ACPPVW_12405 [Leifsonia sp. McL0607]|uniref:hypothetical protein n=1 Tax=Leifsonia sp. McL0607 TaxID=3415672 RepID=UPI003CF6E622
MVYRSLLERETEAADRPSPSGGAAGRLAVSVEIPYGLLPDLLAELADLDTDWVSELPDAVRELGVSVAAAALAAADIRESATGVLAYELDELLRYRP